MSRVWELTEQFQDPEQQPDRETMRELFTAINEALEDSPELVNSDPYGEGWMITIKVSDPSEADALMDKDAYLNTLKG